jgi:putative heme-binding domain-containing protein
MPRKQTTAVLTIALLISCATTALAVESWADPKLPVKEGLELWLDATHAGGEKPIADFAALGDWRDASGRGRNLKQSNKDARPTLLKVGPIAIARFDGIDDHLRAVKQNTKLDAFTIVLVTSPRQNLGDFRGFLALNAKDRRDYESGLNVDMGPTATTQFSTLNVEGHGFGGAQNLLKRELQFSRLHTLTITSGAGDKSVRLTTDNENEDQRPRDGSTLSMDELTIGARYYNNGSGQQQVTGFGRTDIAEMLIYNRALSKEELVEVQKYLSDKYDKVKDVLPADRELLASQLEMVKDPPPVQMLSPGFTVHQLPLDLTNVNNVKYREDGTLVALAYDGKIWLLRDTDGDGLEDRPDLFWDNPSGLRSPIGMDLTPPGYERGRGVFVVGKTKCLLIVDTDGDEKADKEIEVAGGWKESFHQVDGLGVAYDPRDGSVYYGRGTYNFADPLLKDKDGKPQYKLTDESGAIIRVSPDFKTHEIIATGIRFPVALRLNNRGDLFATDQEGATWVPNGNPFDELLHIQKGRHYGFPPRHPEYVPNVIDEPSTFDFTPQHQSTCGFNFNYPLVKDGPTFGPKTWAGDAIVTGESRGKLWRTNLAHTPAGYVASTNLLACLSMLTVDACVSLDGGLVITCHSGGPDWGSGPSGKGKLFKVSYTDPEHPQPVVTWASGPREVRVEFDRPVPPGMLHNVLEKAKLTGGRYVRAGDRFESLAPGYAAVQAQKSTPRFDVSIRSAQLTPDGRTLVLATDPISRAVHYALTLPDEARPKADDEKALPQHASIDLDFDLTGCNVEWKAAEGDGAWKGWLPHIDLDASREFTRGSDPHETLWKLLESPGTLTLRGQLDLTDMLRPAIQPGSKIDYEYPPESVTVTFRTDADTLISFGELHDSLGKATFTAPADGPKKVPFEFHLLKKAGPATLSVDWTTNEDSRFRPLPLRRALLPWADTSDKPNDKLVATRPPELEGGSWARGYREFHGEKAMCAKCHSIYGRGGSIGPDLSNLQHRDYASVLRDIDHPSFALNPDYLGYNITLKDGRVLTGVVRSSKDDIKIGDTKGNTTTVKRDEIDEMKASPISTMPEKLPDELGPERMRDLLTFLLTPPPSMPHDHPGERPKPRTVAEVEAVLAGAPNPPEQVRPLNILLVAGPKDHGIGEHDYPAWQKIWPALLSAASRTNVATAWEWPTDDELKQADVIVLFQRGTWNDQRAKDTDAFLERGGGLVYLHWALDGGDNGAEFAKRIGFAKDKALAFRHGPMDLAFNKSSKNPIIRNLEHVHLVDEAYWQLAGSVPPENILATSQEGGEPQPQIWVTEHGKGRVMVAIPGHYSWTFDDPLYRLLVLRGIAWVAHEPVDRFNELVWLGADR